MKPGIYYRGQCDYDRIDAVNISRLLLIDKSELHYLANPRISTKPMALGTAAHAATLEPERFASDFAVWDRKTETGRSAPRTGKAWEAFVALHSGQEIITDAENRDASAIAHAVYRDPDCARILEFGSPEVTLVWESDSGILCKGRVDWFREAVSGGVTFADLKTAADIRPGVFLSKAAKLHYHTRMAWYRDAIARLLGTEDIESLVLAVESGYPHDVAVYELFEDELAEGRFEYERLLTRLQFALDSGNYPGIAGGARIKYTLPKWAVDDPEDETDTELDWSKTDVRSA